MKKHTSKYFTALLTLIFLITGAGAKACMMHVPREMEDINAADVVFTGEVVDYQVITPEGKESGRLWDYALITLSVTDTLKGDAKDIWQLYWWNSTYGIPEILRLKKQVIIAAISADKPMLPLRGPSATVFGTQRPDLLMVLQAPCSSPFMFNYDPDTLKRIKNALAGRPVEEGIPKRCYRWKRVNGKQIKTEYPCPEE